MERGAKQRHIRSIMGFLGPSFQIVASSATRQAEARATFERDLDKMTEESLSNMVILLGQLSTSSERYGEEAAAKRYGTYADGYAAALAGIEGGCK